MGWVKLDDGFYDHPRMIGCTLVDLGLWAVGLAYSNKHLLNGFVPASFVKARRGKPDKLVACGAWEPAEGGWWIRDYLQHQRSAEEIRELSARRAEAGSKGGSKTQANAKQEPSKSEANVKQKEKKERKEEKEGGERRLHPDERKARIEHTAALIAKRRGNEAKGAQYFNSSVRGIAADYHDAAHEHLTADPALTAEELADLLEPPLEVRPPFTNCPECKVRYQRTDGQCLHGYDVCPMRRAV